MSTNPHHEYEPTGLASINQIPTHWYARRLGQIGTFTKGSGGNKDDATDYGLPCIRYGDIYTSYKYHARHARSYISKDRAPDYARLKHGDALFAASGETVEDIGKSVVNLMTEEAYCGPDIILFRPEAEINPSYLGYVLDCPKIAYQKSCMGRGITIMHIYSSSLKYITIPLPPLEEQAAIVRYLDHADELVSHYISAKERLIALLEEQRQAVIQQFITRGLDLTVHLKPSGVEWFGDVPGHWEIRRLAELHLDVTSGTWGEEPTGTGDIACVRVADFDRHHLRAKTDNPTMRHVNNQEVARKRLAKGDLLLEKSGGGDLQPVGIVVLFDTDIPAVCTNFVARLRPAQICKSKYALAIHSTLYAMRVNTRSIKQTTGIQNLDLDTYFSEIIPLPPLPDQCAIIARIDQETARIDASIKLAERQIGLTNEYRTRLIDDVVTGQIDVRNAAVELPD